MMVMYVLFANKCALLGISEALSLEGRHSRLVVLLREPLRNQRGVAIGRALSLQLSL